MDASGNKLIVPQWFELELDQIETWNPLLDQLVPAPPLMTELSGPQLSLGDFDARLMAEKVSHDAVLTARILAVANSARFGLTQPMTSIQRAMVHLGFNMVKSIIVTYMLESRFSKPLPVPRKLMEHIQHWTAGASVIAFRWGQAAELRDPATAATLALLSRIGSLLLGLAKPPPGVEYAEFTTETERLAFEMKTWGVTTPTLGGELARRWDVPQPIPRLIERCWEPLAGVLSPDPLDPDPPVLTLVAASLVLVAGHLRNPEVDPVAALGLPGNRFLNHNLRQHHLNESLATVWGSARIMRELAVVLE